MIRLLTLTLLLVLAQGCGDPRQPAPDSAPDLPPQADLSLDAPAPDTALDSAADLAVDAAAESGADLTPDGPAPDAPSAPTHAACAAALPLTLDAAGGVAVIDTTAWSTSEFGAGVSCGGTAGPWPGPQNYYRIKLVKGISYKVTLRTGGFDGALYAFPAATACSAAAINAACKQTTASGGPPLHLSSDNPGAGADELLRLAPTVSADWIVAVDSAAPQAAGLFQLNVAQATPPTHDACGQAQAVALTGGGATVELQGDTSDADNELGATVTCGGGAHAGPQLYYKVTLTAGDKLALTLRPSFPARAYVFPAASCAAAAINAGCGSGGTSGLALNAAAGASGAALFSPAAGGDFIVAVDSAAPWAGGSFALALQAVTPPQNASCVYAKDLTLDASGAVNVSGSTAGAADEFSALTCGRSALSGPQVYYKLQKLQAGTTYRLLLTPSFAAELYIFSTAAACSLAGIETDCGGAAAKGARMLETTAPNTTRSLYFKPATSGDYFVAVDSLGAAAGPFSLAVARTSAPTNTGCKQAQSVTLTAGKAEVTGETHGSSDEFPGLKCGGFTLLDGPQVYYRLALTAGQTYKLALVPTFSAQLSLYSPAAAKSCTEGALEQDCASKGTAGLTLGPVAAGNVGAALFTAAASGSYGLAVDSADASRAGYFGLNIEAYTAPKNGTCAAPAALTLSTSPALVSGDTAGVGNEFGQAVTCGGAQSYDGPQLYYRLSLKQGKRYTLSLSPQGWDAALYAFTDSSCQPSSITSQCALLGLADAAGLSGEERLTLIPVADGDVLVAVDGAAPAAGGPFALTVSWK